MKLDSSSFMKLSAVALVASMSCGCSKRHFVHESYRPIRIGSPVPSRVALNAPSRTEAAPTVAKTAPVKPQRSGSRAMFHPARDESTATARVAPAPPLTRTQSVVAVRNMPARPPVQTSPPSRPRIAATYADTVDPPAARRPAQPAIRPQQKARRGHASLISMYGNELVSRPQPARSSYASTTSLRQITIGTEGSTFDPDVDPTGQRLVFASTRHRPTADIYLQSTTGTTVTQLTSDLAQDIMPVFHPDGTKVAFASDRHGNWDIFVIGIDGGRPMQVTTDGDDEIHPSWSPDGRRLAYCRFGSQTGRWEIWTLDVENESVPSFLTYGVFPQWSPDVTTNKILFQRPRERGSQYHSVWTIDYIGGEARRPTEIVSAGNAALINPAWSPDGRRIVFVSVVEPQPESTSEPVQSDVWVVDLNGNGRTNLTNGDFANFQPVWSSAGSVYFVSDRSGIDNIWSISATDLMQPMQPNEMDGSGFATADPEHEMAEQP